MEYCLRLGGDPVSPPSRLTLFEHPEPVFPGCPSCFGLAWCDTLMLALWWWSRAAGDSRQGTAWEPLKGSANHIGAPPFRGDRKP